MLFWRAQEFMCNASKALQGLLTALSFGCQHCAHTHNTRWGGHMASSLESGAPCSVPQIVAQGKPPGKSQSRLPAGADKALLKEKNVYRDHLEAAASAGQGRLVRNFQEMHEAIMEKAEDGNT